MVAWTTTPWTLPSNLSLCVHPEMTYIRVRTVTSACIAGSVRMLTKVLQQAISSRLVHMPICLCYGWQVRNPTTGAVYVLLEARLAELPGAVPKASRKKKGKADAPEQPPFEVRTCFNRAWMAPAQDQQWQTLVSLVLIAMEMPQTNNQPGCSSDWAQLTSQFELWPESTADP